MLRLVWAPAGRACRRAGVLVILALVSPCAAHAAFLVVDTQASRSGDAFSDIATLSGESPGEPTPTGTITFYVYGPYSALVPATPTCEGAPLFTSTDPVNAYGEATSEIFTASASYPGIYQFVAHYNGDEHYPPVADACGAPDEAITIPVVSVGAPEAPQPSPPVPTPGHSIVETTTWHRTSLLDWVAVETSARERSIEIAYARASCGERELSAHVHEARGHVAITLTREVTAPSTDAPIISCPGPSVTDIWVRLKHRIAGRAIAGGSSVVVNLRARRFGMASSARTRVPRVTGFSPSDARRALEFGGFRSRTVKAAARSRQSEVVSQDPAAGTVMTHQNLVRLAVGR